MGLLPTAEHAAQVTAADAAALEKKLAAMTGGDAFGGRSRKGLRRWALHLASWLYC